MARLKYWVWLSAVTGVRPLMKYRLLETLGDADRVFFAEEPELLSVPGIRPKEAEHLLDKSMDRVSDILSICDRENISVMTMQDAGYPERLRHIDDPPAVLYVWGRLPEVDEHTTVAVVGTRKASPYGLKMASRMGEELAGAGAVVVSGMAEGCDSAAIEAALRAGGQTVGVLGTAIDRVYPAKNRGLFEAVKKQGALVSEYPPGAPTYPGDFKVRNRIISGLSQGVVVAEAPLHSGTRNTVEHALSQGRDVFAVPGNADGNGSSGCNDLIAQGACLAACGEDVLSVYGCAHGSSETKTLPVSPKKATTHIKKEIDKQKDIVYIDLTDAQKNLPSAQKTVLSVMTRPEMYADEIIEAAGLSAAEVLAAITMLQVTGYITVGAGKRYTRRF